MTRDLKAISKAKELSRLVFEITEKSPKKFRFTLVSRMQNLTLTIISELYAANDVYINKKLLSDMSKVIEHTKKIGSFVSEEERIHYKNKLFELKLTQALKREEILSERLSHSRAALTASRELGWIAEMASETQCITPRQYERIAEALYETRLLIGGYIKSDRERFGG